MKAGAEIIGHVDEDGNFSPEPADPTAGTNEGTDDIKNRREYEMIRGLQKHDNRKSFWDDIADIIDWLG